MKKLESIEKEVKEFEPYQIYGEGNKLIVSWGSNKMPILESLKYLKGWKYLHISYLSPFPKEIKYLLEESREIVSIEHNLKGNIKLCKKSIKIFFRLEFILSFYLESFYLFPILQYLHQ